MTDVQESTKLGARAVLAAAAVILVVVPFSLVLLLVKSEWSPLLRADRGASDGLHGYAVAHPGFVRAMQLISDSGSALAWQIVLGLVVVWLLWRRLPRLALFVVITGVGSSVLNSFVKTTVNRLRPDVIDPVVQEPGLSFPSGHTQAAIVGYAVLLLVFLPVLHGVRRQVAVTLSVIMVLAIAFSRVALGAHYVSDIVGGLVLGGAWVAAMAAAFNATRVDSGQATVDLRQGLEPEESHRLSGHRSGDGGEAGST